MAAPTKRLVIEIEQGIVTRIVADGIDLTGVTAIVVDDDPADPERAIAFGGREVFFGPSDIEHASDEYSSDVRRAYDTWALS